MAYQPGSALSLGIPDVRIVATRLVREQEVVIEVESTLTAIACSRCGRTSSEFDGYAEPQTVRYVPPLGHPVSISFRPRRFRCPYCDDHPTTTQQLNWPPADLEKQVGG